MSFNLIIAGFGGQGVLLVGSVLVRAAILDGKHVTWMPSYGVEMRGGTANCTVVISDEEIGSPVIGHPQNTIIFNLPSKDKFEPLMKSGGLMMVNSSLIEDKVKRKDLNVLYFPGNKMADELGEPKSLNMIAIGAFAEATKIVSIDNLKKALDEVFLKKQNLIEVNKKAIDMGAQFAKEHPIEKAAELVK